MLTTENYKTLTGLALDTATDAQIVAQIGKKLRAETSAAIATALLAHHLLDVRSYSVKEAAQALDVDPGYLSAAAARGHVVHLAATDTTAATVWAQVRSMSLPDTRSMAQALIAQAAEKRGDHLRDSVTRAEVAKRLGDNATPEKVDEIAQRITDAGSVTPKTIRAAIPAVAESVGVSLPKQNRSGTPDQVTVDKASKVPTFTEALSMFERANLDRMEGSDDEAPYALTDEEAGAVVALIAQGFGALMRAGRVAEIIDATATANTAAESVTEPATA